MDRVSQKVRSKIMSAIHSKNTSVERRVFRHLREQGINFQRHYRRAAGSPDIALPRKKIAIFIDGDFWHGWHFKARRRKLSQYWRDKIERNIRRDRRNRAQLRRAGWRVMRVWEHQIEGDPISVLNKIRRLIGCKSS